MTPTEVEQLSQAISQGIRRAGLAFGGREDADGSSKADDRAARKTIVRALSSTRNLGKAADTATASLRLLAKSSALATIGLTHLGVELKKATLATSKMKPTDVAKMQELEKKMLGLIDNATRLFDGGPIARPIKAKPEKPEPKDKDSKSKEPADTEPKDDKKETQLQKRWVRVSTMLYNGLLKKPKDWSAAKLANLDPTSRRARFVNHFKNEDGFWAKNSELLKSSIERLAYTIRFDGVQALDLAFQTLAQRGYAWTAAFNPFSSLSSAAMRAGMSLLDYTRMMDESMGVVARSSSFAEFNSLLTKGRESLRKFGVLGADAATAVASLATSSVQLGIPYAQLDNAIQSQIALFGRLQKSSGMTADKFSQLSRELSDNAGFQAELLALAPSERLTRQQQVLEQMSYAKSLNLSEQAQRAYTSAVIEMRRSTVKTRFQQAGRLMQAASIVGLGGDKTNELRQLSMTRNKSEEQTKRYMQLLGEVNMGLEQMQQTGGAAYQYIADTVSENLNTTGLQQQLEAATAIRLGKDAGQNRNADMGVKLDGIGATLGDLLVTVRGIAENPVWRMLASGISTIVSTLLLMRFAQEAGSTAKAAVAGVAAGEAAAPIIAAAVRGSSALDVDLDKMEKEGKGGKTGKGRFAGKMLGIAGTIAGAAAVTAAITPSNISEIEEKQGVISALKTAFSDPALWGGLIGVVGGTLVGGPFGATVGGIIGGQLGEFFKSSKKEAEETTKNTDATKKLTDELHAARKAQKGSDVIDAYSTTGLRQNVLGSAIAATTASQEEIKREQERRAKLSSVVQPRSSTMPDTDAARYFMSADDQNRLDDLLRKRKSATTEKDVVEIEKQLRALIAPALGKSVSDVVLPDIVARTTEAAKTATQAIAPVEGNASVQRQLQEQDAIRATPPASSRATIAQPQLATPASQPQATVNPPTINTPEVEAPTSKATTIDTSKLLESPAAQKTQEALLAEAIRAREVAQAQLDAITDLTQRLAARPHQLSNVELFRRNNA